MDEPGQFWGKRRRLGLLENLNWFDSRENWKQRCCIPRREEGRWISANAIVKPTTIKGQLNSPFWSIHSLSQNSSFSPSSPIPSPPNTQTMARLTLVCFGLLVLLLLSPLLVQSQDDDGELTITIDESRQSCWLTDEEKTANGKKCGNRKKWVYCSNCKRARKVKLTFNEWYCGKNDCTDWAGVCKECIR